MLIYTLYFTLRAASTKEHRRNKRRDKKNVKNVKNVEEKKRKKRLLHLCKITPSTAIRYGDKQK